MNIDISIGKSLSRHTGFMVNQIIKPAILGLAFAATLCFTTSTAYADGAYLGGHITFGNISADRGHPKDYDLGHYGHPNVHRPAHSHNAHQYDHYHGHEYKGGKRKRHLRQRAVRTCEQAMLDQFGHRRSAVMIKRVDPIYRPGPDGFKVTAIVHRHGHRRKIIRPPLKVKCFAHNSGGYPRLVSKPLRSGHSYGEHIGWR